MATKPKRSSMPTPTTNLNAPTLGAVQPNLAVTHVKDAVHFYTKIGFQAQFTVPGPNGEPTFAILTFGNGLVHVSNVEGPHPDAKRSRQIKDGPRGLGVVLYTIVPDVDAVHRNLVEAGAKIYQAPKDEFWGDRVTTCIDPFGYEWAFAQHVRDVGPDEMMKATAGAGSP